MSAYLINFIDIYLYPRYNIYDINSLVN